MAFNRETEVPTAKYVISLIVLDFENNDSIFEVIVFFEWIQFIFFYGFMIFKKQNGYRLLPGVSFSSDSFNFHVKIHC